MRLLIKHLGNVEAERFITLMNREPFDYTQWQQDMFAGMLVRELSKDAMQKNSLCFPARECEKYHVKKYEYPFFS
jgi:hypothetical protein